MQLLNNLHYYVFKIFLFVCLAKIPRIILHNQLALTTFGRRLRYVENDVNTGYGFRLHIKTVIQQI